MRPRGAAPSGLKRHAAALGLIALVLALAGCSVGAGGAAPLPSAGGAALLKTADLFADQGPLYDSNLEPDATDAVTLTLRTAHDNVTSVNIEYYDTAGGAYHYVPMRVAAIDPTGRFDEWRGAVPAGAAEKRYRFEISNGTQTVWYNAAGVSATQPSSGDFFIVPGFRTPQWMKHGTMYEIFVDRFADGDPANDIASGAYTYAGCATERHAWGKSPYATVRGCNAEVFFGGDLAGIDQKLGYIKQTLGADIVYLTPIFAAPSNHKYDTADYYEVDPAFGTTADLQKLIRDVHRSANGPRGYLILDGVFNHTGDSDCWFGRETYGARSCRVTGAYRSRSSPYFSWYTFQRWPTHYSSFLDLVPTMPKLNYGAHGSPVREQIYAGPHSVVQTYLRAPYGIDGWRLDSAQLLDADGHGGSDATNHRIMRELRAAVLSVNPDAQILGEYWRDPAPWLDDGEQWDSAMNYHGFTDPVSEWLCGVTESGRTAALDVTQFDAWLRAARADIPTNALEAMTNELGSQDTPRFATRCGGSLAKTELAMVFQFTYIGTPTIYYGDEYGMQGGRDPDDRRTFDWAKATLADPPVAFAHELIGIRRAYTALQTGSFMTLVADDADDVYAYGRFDARHRIAVVLNAGSSAHSVTVPVGELSMIDGSAVRDLLSDATYLIADGDVTVSVPADSAVILAQ